ncbi:MAG TPA: M23 family metallopeptidase [Bacteroidales bacterium]|nr:M23 family metallopeptidase [Bacteroidales bacterium]HPL04320.1 M23 family metallopeptidase [Bacteroidales bacterium]
MILYIIIYESPEEKLLRAEVKFLQENLNKINQRLKVNDSLLNVIANNDNYIYRSTFELDSIPISVRNAGVGGSDRYKIFDGYNSTEIIKDVAKQLDEFELKLKIQDESYKILLAEIKKRDNIFKSLPVLQPIHVNELTRIGSFYGYRPHPILGVIQMHHGIDMVAPTGTPVYASGDGVVEHVEKIRTGYGNNIVINHGVNGLKSRYAHLYTINVKKGQKVKRGELIGTVGSTGLSTAPHLHYEILINNSSVNPLRYMIAPNPSEYEQLINETQYPGKSFD